MSKIHDIVNEFPDSLMDEQDEQRRRLSASLKSVRPGDLKTLADHRRFIEILAKFRMSILYNDQFHGENFLTTLESMLSVGADGVYSNSLRFIYELIQNVDDCDYDDITNCSLDVQFCYSKDRGRIEFIYNEKGFKPENVFAITGIAAASKNISKDRVEIGEKGLGFKSVFGIADRVTIQSGMFSFALERETFTVPVPKYENYAPIKGTKLTLEMSAAKCKDLYRELVRMYKQKDVLLNKNPILFLNKLTHLKIFVDTFRYIEFDVQRVNPEICGDLRVESNIAISVDMKDHDNGLDNEQKYRIKCFRYSMPIVYGRDACVSRYGEDTQLEERRHNLVAVFPVFADKAETFSGTLYSFLPTQVKINVPLLLQVPYKLNVSREFVDSQENNTWFSFTTEKLIVFIRQIFIHLAQTVKQEIVNYLPGKEQFLFRSDNEKVRCLQVSGLRGKDICQEKIFYTEENHFQNVEHILSFGENESVNDPVEVYLLLDEKDELFVPSRPVDMKKFGARVISDIPTTLFRRGFQNPERLDDILVWLEKNQDRNLNYFNLLTENPPPTLTVDLLETISKHKRLSEAFQKLSSDCIRQNRAPAYRVSDSIPAISEERRAEIIELIHDANLEQVFNVYLERRNYRFLRVKGYKDFSLAANNAIVLSENSELFSFGKLSEVFDSNGTFSASLKIRAASERLNQADGDDTVDNLQYLKMLSDSRRSLRDAFGQKVYARYIRAIIETSADESRFLSELLQNADDCSYDDGILPELTLSLDGDYLDISYNEQGFTKSNVRALTAIGDSTKKTLLAGNAESIGEKGIGFKSVFGVAESVEIHSNGFDFMLTDKHPTIPTKCSAAKGVIGTKMRFQMKKQIEGLLTPETLLALCMCLRNLKKLHINGHEIQIVDEDSKRVIKVNKTKRVYERITHSFEITDERALAERRANGPIISAFQTIVCYLPGTRDNLDRYVYTGLPTAITCNVPIIIDAPFELTSSREDILDNAWNRIIRDEVYATILEVMDLKKSTGLDVLKYVGFTARAGVSPWGTFSSDWLNCFNWEDELNGMEILPILGEDSYASASDGCVIVPEFIARQKNLDLLNECFAGYIIDISGKSQYSSLLEEIGCWKADENEICDYLSQTVNEAGSSALYDISFREGLYSYLKNEQNYGSSGWIGELVLDLAIFPVKLNEGTVFIRFREDIYTHVEQKSTDDYFILDTEIMSAKLAKEILGSNGEIHALTEEVLDAKYQKLVTSKIESARDAASRKEVAEYLRKEFSKNKEQLRKCKYALLGLTNKIPLLMQNGTYRQGYKHRNVNHRIFKGTLIPMFVVSNAYDDLAKFLDLTDIESVHFDDFDCEIGDISDDDLEDMQTFKNYSDIVRNLVNQELVSDEQIEKYNLDFVYIPLRSGGRSDDCDDADEDFPQKEVRDLERLRRHVGELWRQPNPYVEKKYIRWQPSSSLDKVGYTKNMYRSEESEKCFCQMCKGKFDDRYIERDNIEKNPVFAWEQMYLSLCLHCSKDYLALRNNKVLWKQFVEQIMQTDVTESGLFEITIDQKTLTFTATHLAEIQEIFKLEGLNSDNPRRREPKLGNSEEDEEIR